jgi:Phage-related minor tail protein
MAKVIEAVARIVAEDKTGAVFDKIAKKIDAIGKSAKSSVAVDKLSKSLEAAQKQMTAIDKFGAARGGFADARLRFRETEMAVQRAAAAMKRGEGDARALQRSYDSAQKAVSNASAAFERQKSALISNKRALDEMGIPANRAVQHQNNLRKAVERTSTALERQEKVQQRRENRRIAVGTAAAAAGAFAGHELKAGTVATLHTYREFDKARRFGKAVMGLTDEQQAPLVAQAIHMGAKTKFNDIQVLDAQRELAARGLKKEQILGMMTPAGNLGMAMDLPLPEAVKQMEGAMFGFKKNISDTPSALASAQQTADYQVKAAKISGMTPEDIRQLYKFGATPARMGGVSEASLLGFGGVLKKANIGGDEAGVAFRALMSTVQAPTAGAKTAMLANGLNYKNYQHMRDHLDVAPFADDVAARYGVKLDAGTKAGLGKIFANKGLISDPAKFNPAVTALLRDRLEGADAKSLKSIAGAAGRYRDSSVDAVDANAMIKDLLPKLANNPQLANKLFGSKQGSRIATALGDGDTMKHIIDEIENHSSGYSEKIAGERMSGFDGAVSRFEGAVKNLETAVGRSFDNDGKGGLLTWVTNAIGGAIQKAAEANPNLIAGGALTAGGLGLGATGYGAFKFMQMMTGGGLAASATALDGAAAALTAAAAELSGASIVQKGGTAAAAAAGGLGSKIWGAGAAALPFLGAVGFGAGAYYLAEGANERQGLTKEAHRSRVSRLAARNNWFNWGGDDSPGVTDTMTYGTGVGGDKSLSVSVTGDVKGQGEMTVKVEAGSTLLQVVEQARAAIRLAGSIQSNGPGSLGHSSPDAAAPAPKASTGGASGGW